MSQIIVFAISLTLHLCGVTAFDFVNEPDNITVIEGDTVTFPCSVDITELHGKSLSTYWTRESDRAVLSENNNTAKYSRLHPRLAARLSILGNYTRHEYNLRISHVEMSDFGFYSCWHLDVGRYSHYASRAYLNVLSKSSRFWFPFCFRQHVSETGGIGVTVGSTVRFSCAVSSDVQLPESLFWTFNRSSNEDFSDLGEIGRCSEFPCSFVYTLQLADANTRFVCGTTFQGENYSDECGLTPLHRRAEILVTSTSSRFTVGSTGHFYCSTFNNGNVKYQWFIGTESVTELSVDNNFNIRNVSDKLDDVAITCVVSDTVGYLGSSSYIIRVTEPTTHVVTEKLSKVTSENTLTSKSSLFMQATSSASTKTFKFLTEHEASEVLATSLQPKTSQNKLIFKILPTKMEINPTVSINTPPKYEQQSNPFWDNGFTEHFLVYAIAVVLLLICMVLAMVICAKSRNDRMMYIEKSTDSKDDTLNNSICIHNANVIGGIELEEFQKETEASILSDKIPELQRISKGNETQRYSLRGETNRNSNETTEALVRDATEPSYLYSQQRLSTKRASIEFTEISEDGDSLSGETNRNSNEAEEILLGDTPQSSLTYSQQRLSTKTASIEFTEIDEEPDSDENTERQEEEAEVSFSLMHMKSSSDDVKFLNYKYNNLMLNRKASLPVQHTHSALYAVTNIIQTAKGRHSVIILPNEGESSDPYDRPIIARCRSIEDLTLPTDSLTYPGDFYSPLDSKQSFQYFQNQHGIDEINLPNHLHTSYLHDNELNNQSNPSDHFVLRPSSKISCGSGDYAEIASLSRRSSKASTHLSYKEDFMSRISQASFYEEENGDSIHSEDGDSIHSEEQSGDAKIECLGDSEMDNEKRKYDEGRDS